MNSPNKFVSTHPFIRDAIVAHYFASSDVSSRYSNSIIGIFWYTVSLIVPLLFLSWIWIVLLEQEIKVFFPHFAIGYLVWTTISSVLILASTAFLKSAATMKITKVRPRLFIMEIIFCKIMETKGAAFLIATVVILIDRSIISSTINLIYLVIAFISVSFALYHACIIISYSGARYADTEPLLSTFLNMLFFATPIIYFPDRLGDFQYLLYFNPIFYIIEAIRQPFLNESPSNLIYFILIFIGLALYAISCKIEKSYSGNVAMWVQK